MKCKKMKWGQVVKQVINIGNIQKMEIMYLNNRYTVVSIVGGIVGLLGVAIYIIITKTVQGPLVEPPLVVIHGQCSD